MGNTANKISGAIQWINNPFNVTFKITADAAFLTEKTMVWVGFLYIIDNGFF